MTETRLDDARAVVDEVARGGLAELHTHLGGSVDPASMWTLAHEQGIALPVKDYWEFVAVAGPRASDEHGRRLGFRR